MCAGVVGNGVGGTGGVDGPPPESDPCRCPLILCWLVAEAVALPNGVGLTVVPVAPGLLSGVMGSVGIGGTGIVGAGVVALVLVGVAPIPTVGEGIGVTIGDAMLVAVG